MLKWKFGTKRIYILLNEYDTKAEAVRHAKADRARGHYARVVKSGKLWQYWIA